MNERIGIKTVKARTDWPVDWPMKRVNLLKDAICDAFGGMFGIKSVDIVLAEGGKKDFEVTFFRRGRNPSTAKIKQRVDAIRSFAVGFDFGLVCGVDRCVKGRMPDALPRKN